MQKKYAIAAVAALVLIAGAGAYQYFSRPVKAPSMYKMEGDQGNRMPPPGGAKKELKAASSVPAVAVEAAQGQSVYRIEPGAGSKATFTLNEVLRGSPFTVVGQTDQLSGEVATDMNAVTGTQIGTITINARTLHTDSKQRDGAVARMILRSEDDANEMITFKPTAVTGLPDKAELGKEFTFEVTGDLTVSGQTHSTTFKGIGQFVSDTELTGKADTMVHYGDYGLAVPNLPFLANVDQDAKLSIEFSAKKVSN